MDGQAARLNIVASQTPSSRSCARRASRACTRESPPTFAARAALGDSTFYCNLSAPRLQGHIGTNPASLFPVEQLQHDQDVDSEGQHDDATRADNAHDRCSWSRSVDSRHDESDLGCENPPMPAVRTRNAITARPLQRYGWRAGQNLSLGRRSRTVQSKTCFCRVFSAHLFSACVFNDLIDCVSSAGFRAWNVRRESRRAAVYDLRRNEEQVQSIPERSDRREDGD